MKITFLDPEFHIEACVDGSSLVVRTSFAVGEIFYMKTAYWSPWRGWSIKKLIHDEIIVYSAVAPDVVRHLLPESVLLPGIEREIGLLIADPTSLFVSLSVMES